MLATVLQWLVLAALTGMIVGTGTSFFLHGLSFASGKTDTLSIWWLMVLLPVGGLLNGLLLHYGARLNKSGLKDSVITSVHKQCGRMPFSTMLIKPIAAIITLACGGSAGKEGPGSHIGGTLAAAFGQLLGLNVEMQKRLVACGVSAGFASVFGTPIAGAIYGVEVLSIGRVRHDFLFPAIVAGVISFQVSKLWGIPYDYYTLPALPFIPGVLFIKTILIGVLCGIVAWIFVEAIQATRVACFRFRDQNHIWPPLMPLLGGMLLAGLIMVIPRDYFGLSLPLMDRALSGEVVSNFGFLFKTILVAVTLGSGFYGGIVTPQFVIGAIAGSAFAHLLGVDPALGAAVGLVAVVAAASNTPIAAILMGVELFGGTVAPAYIAGAGIAAYLIIGHRSVYPDQTLAYAKTSWMKVRPDMTMGEEKIHLSDGLLKWLGRYRIGRKIGRLRRKAAKQRERLKRR